MQSFGLGSRAPRWLRSSVTRARCGNFNKTETRSCTRTWKMVYARKVDVVRIGRSVRILENSIEKLIDDGTIPAGPDDQN
jgi:hypothetical protein